MNIPNQIQDMNFVLLAGDDGKKPIEKGWTNLIHKINCPVFQSHIQQGGNYGVQMNGSFVNGKPLIVIDFDSREFQDKVIPQFPETFTTTSGSAKQCYHLWFCSNKNEAFKIHDAQKNTLADVLGSGNQVVSVGSLHKKSGNRYSVVKDLPIAFLDYAQIEAILKPYDETPKKEVKVVTIHKENKSDIISKVVNAVSMQTILQEVGIDTSKNPTNCFGHSSVGGKCFSWNSEVCHCFHCDNSWNKYSLIREAKNLSDKDTILWFVEQSGMQKEYDQARQEYLNQFQEPKGWACSINIKVMAQRYNFLNCHICNTPFQFDERLGRYACPSCRFDGGIKQFAFLCAKKKMQGVSQ